MNTRLKKKIESRNGHFRYFKFYEDKRYKLYLKKYKELHGEINQNDVIYVVNNGKRGKKQRIVSFSVLKNCHLTDVHPSISKDEFDCHKNEDGTVEMTFACNPIQNEQVENLKNYLLRQYKEVTN